MSVTMPWTASDVTPLNGVASKFEEVRRSLSKEAEHLAEMAAQYGRDATAHAADIADDASKQAAKVARDASKSASNVASDPVGHAGNWANGLVKAVVGLGTALALGSRRTAQDLTENAQGVAKDLRKVRITTEPKKTGPDFMPGVTLLAGFGSGIALMYFLDPERGRVRRNMLRDKLKSWSRKASETAAGTAKDLGNRAGAMYETRNQLQGQAAREQLDASPETQTWQTPTDHGNGDGSSDTSTTDTWGTQPQPSENTASVG